jgi:Domain of unknown function (DUF1906)
MGDMMPPAGYSTWADWKESVLGSEVPATSGVMGFDYVDYPGDTVMTSWWTNSPFFYVGFYLGPAPYHTDASFMTKRTTLKNLGWGFLITYVGQQAASKKLNYSQGQADATNAQQLAQSAGFPRNAIIFLDIETGGTLSSDFITYIKSWTSGIYINDYYEAGVYCNTSSATQIAAAVSPTPVTFWCVNVNCGPSPGCSIPSSPPAPSACGYSPAAAWQYAQSPEPVGTGCSNYTGGTCPQTFGGHLLDIDLDTATSLNPSQG